MFENLFGTSKDPKNIETGFVAATTIMALTHRVWPQAHVNIGIQVSNLPDQMPAKCYSVFIVNHFWRNVWRPVIPEADVPMFANGIKGALSVEQRDAMNRLVKRLEELVEFFGSNAVPLNQYHRVIGQWYLECIGLYDNVDGTATLVGRCLFNQATYLAGLIKAKCQ